VGQAMLAVLLQALDHPSATRLARDRAGAVLFKLSAASLGPKATAARLHVNCLLAFVRNVTLVAAHNLGVRAVLRNLSMRIVS